MYEKDSSDAFSLTRKGAAVEAWGKVFLLVIFLAASPAYAKRIDPKWPRPEPEDFIPFRLQKGKSYLKEQNWTEAAKIFSEILQKKPDHLAAALELSKSLTYQSDRIRALEVLTRQLEIQRGTARDTVVRRIKVLSQLFFDGAHYENFQGAMNFLVEGKESEALKKMESSLKEEPTNIRVILRHAQCLEFIGKTSDALENLERAKKINPFEPEVRLWLGRSLLEAGRNGEAAVELKQAHVDLKRSELAPLWLSRALALTGQKKDAITLLENDIKTEPLHLMSLLELVKYNHQMATADPQALWRARELLQLASSRFTLYSETLASNRAFFESELGWSPYDSQRIKSEIHAWTRRTDEGLKAVRPDSAELPK